MLLLLRTQPSCSSRIQRKSEAAVIGFIYALVCSDMTLVVGRIHGDRVSIASDTRITQSGLPLKSVTGILKSCVAPGGVCISFAHSPELAVRDIKNFIAAFPWGTTRTNTISYFTQSSRNTENQYLIAFAAKPELVKIADGAVVKGLAKTQWIGDQSAFERFREYETRNRKFPQAGRAFNAVLFADELNKSPASDLYSTMRNVVLDQTVSSTGGFVLCISNRDNGFRQAAYSDMLYDWPNNESDDFELDLNHPLNLGSSGENIGHAVAQISPGIMNANIAGFYMLGGKKLFLFYGEKNGPADKCVIFNNVEPDEIAPRLNRTLGVNMYWLLMITSPQGSEQQTSLRTETSVEGPNGIGISFFCHANTFPKEA